MKVQKREIENRMVRPGTRIAFGILVTLWSISSSCFAAEFDPDEKIPPLRPARPLMPPEFWELYGSWVITASIFAVLLLAGVIWLLLRPRARRLVPAAVQARTALSSLRHQAETGPLLTRVSQVVRSYFGVVFGLPPGELTTGEFCRALQGNKEVGDELKQQVGEFLHICDERKFAPAGPTVPLGVVGRAEKLIEAAETRRASLASASKQGQHQQAGTKAA